jgi:hypothetical protein
VRSDGEDRARERAHEIISERRYESIGELATYREEAATLPATDESGETGVRGGYLGMRQQAIDRGDGLFELWYPEEPDEPRQ